MKDGTGIREIAKEERRRLASSFLLQPESRESEERVRWAVDRAETRAGRG